MSATEDEDLYLISYDLKYPDADYSTLWAALRDWEAENVLKSQWVLRSPDTAAQVKNYVSSHVRSIDEVLVVNLSKGGWSSNRRKISRTLKAK